MKKLMLSSLLGFALLSTPALAAEYAIDNHHTYVFFEIGHNNTSTNHARFNGISGKINFDKTKKTGSADIVVKVDSVSSGSVDFDNHLKAADIFNLAKFPEFKFKSTKFVFDGEKVSEVQGDLTLLGVAKPITFKATNFNCYDNKRAKTETCGGDFVAVFDRTQWGNSANYGVSWGSPKDVKIVIQIEANKK